jgi:hypothetical protein
MTQGQRLKLLCAGFAIACVGVTVSLTPSQRAKADDKNLNSDSRVQLGFAAVPDTIHLNMEGKNPALVGLGSYFVNVAGDCNGCHSAGPPTEFTHTGNPYTGAKEQVNPATYLGGGRDFGFLGPPSNSRTRPTSSRATSLRTRVMDCLKVAQHSTTSCNT